MAAMEKKCSKLKQKINIIWELSFWFLSTTIYYIKGIINAVIEQRTLKNINNYLNTNIYSHLETSGGQSSMLYLNVVHFLNTCAIYTPVAA